MEGISAIGGSFRDELTPAERAEVAKLAERDREVRAHEAAHMAAAGSMAGGVSYTYEMGPDGRMYAVGGEVKIHVPSSSSPEDALEKARQLREAAGAPSDPSGQDMAVASKASQMEARAMQQIARKNADESCSSSKGTSQPRGLDCFA